MLNIGVCNSSISCFVLKWAMSRIARLLSHHSFGAENSLERQKNLLIKRVSRGLSAPSRFPPRFDIKLSRSWQVRVWNYRPNNKKYENNKLSKISPTTFLFHFGFRIQNEKVRLAWQPRRTWHSPFKILRFVWYVNDLTGDVTLHNDLLKDRGIFEWSKYTTHNFACRGVHTWKCIVSSDFDKYS